MNTPEQAIKDLAASKIQRWVLSRSEANILRGKFRIIGKDLVAVNEQLQLFSLIENFEDAPALFVQDIYIRPVGAFLKALAAAKGLQHLKPATNASHISRMISSALMISKFPEQVLFSDSDTADGGELLKSAQLDHETKNCLVDARTLFVCLRKLVASAIPSSAPAISTKKLSSLLHNFFFALRSFLRSFEDWRRADARKLAASLQDSFAQTYAVYIAATVGDVGFGDQAEILLASQKQLEKIRGALVQILGPQLASNKIEEICASVEATYYAGRANSSVDDASEPSTPVPVRGTAESPKPKQSGPETTNLHQSILSSSPGGESFIGSLQQPESSLASNHLKILNKLSQLAGIGQERLAYEIVLNPYYRLPTPADLPATETVASPGGPLSRSNSSSGLSAAGSGPPSLRRDTSNHTLSSALSLQDPASVVNSLRNQMLRMMSDKLINSVRRSSILSTDEVSVLFMVFVFAAYVLFS